MVRNVAETLVVTYTILRSMTYNSAEAEKDKRIVLVTPTLDGGVGRVTSLLAKGFAEAGHETTVWTLARGAYASDVAAVTKLTASRALGTFRQLVQLFKTEKPDIVLSASYHMNCLVVMARIMARSKSKLFLVEHTALETGLGTINLLKRLLAKTAIWLCYPLADGWIAVSKDVARQMARFGGLEETQVTVIYNPVLSPSVYDASEEAIQHPFFAAAEPTLLAVGRLSEEKDYPTLLEALALARRQTNLNLVILGDGPDRTALEEQVRILELTEAVSFVGQVTNPYPYYRQADLFVLSSTREGLPTVLIEAMALGLPIISTDAKSGPREILHDGALGALVPVTDPKALSDAIVSALRNPAPEISAEELKPYESGFAINAYLNVLLSP